MARQAQQEMAQDTRPALATMTDSEKIDEVLTIMRQCQDALIAMSNNPMMRAMGAKFGS